MSNLLGCLDDVKDAAAPLTHPGASTFSPMPSQVRVTVPGSSRISGCRRMSGLPERRPADGCLDHHHGAQRRCLQAGPWLVVLAGASRSRATGCLWLMELPRCLGGFTPAALVPGLNSSPMPTSLVHRSAARCSSPTWCC